MAYDSNINPGSPPLKWSRIKEALDKINENFTIIGSSIATYTPTDISAIDQSNPVKITTSGQHGVSNEFEILVLNSGVSQLDGNRYYVQVTSTTELLLYTDQALTTAVNGTAFDAYSSGGTITAFSPFASIDFNNFYSDITPADTGTYSLGNFTNMWKEVHIESQSSTPGSENNGLWLGLAKIQSVDTVIDLPLNSTVNGQLIINPDQTFFKSVELDNGDRIVADEFVDTLNLLSGTAIQLTADSGAESITITNTGVTQLSAGTAISVSSATGNITVTNTGVTSLTNSPTLPSGLSAGSGIAVDNSTGDVTITNTGVIEVQQGFGITVFTDTATGIATISNNAPAVPTFQTFSVQGQPGVSPDNTSDTIEFVEGYGIIMTTDASNDKITFAVNNNIDIIGSVFADDSTILVDGLTGKIVGDVLNSRVVTELVDAPTDDLYVTAVNDGTLYLGTTNTRTVTIGASNTTVYVNGDDDSIIAGGQFIGDLKGSVFGDDSTLIIDAVANTLNGNLTGDVTGDLTGNVTGDITGNVTGDLTGNVTGNVTGNLTGNLNGYQTGDMTGSVFADDSTTLVDAVEGQIVGPIRSSDIRGDLIGSVFADDSTMLVNGIDGSLSYTATTPTDWNGDAPTSVGEAIDRLATLVKTLNGGTGA